MTIHPRAISPWAAVTGLLLFSGRNPKRPPQARKKLLHAEPSSCKISFSRGNVR